MSEQRPRLWSDFDGTAVGLISRANPYNWSKYPLPKKEGYVEFLRGVQSTDVEMGGIVSRRPDIALRRMATRRSVAKLGINEFFAHPEQILHTTTEVAKADFVVEQSKITTIGMLDDRPHKFGKELLNSLARVEPGVDDKLHPILLGVVSHVRSHEYMDRFVREIGTKAKAHWDIHEIDEQTGNPAFVFENGQHTVHMIALEPYSFPAGEAFGQKLHEIA